MVTVWKQIMTSNISQHITQPIHTPSSTVPGQEDSNQGKVKHHPAKHNLLSKTSAAPAKSLSLSERKVSVSESKQAQVSPDNLKNLTPKQQATHIFDEFLAHNPNMKNPENTGDFEALIQMIKKSNPASSSAVQKMSQKTGLSIKEAKLVLTALEKQLVTHCKACFSQKIDPDSKNPAKEKHLKKMLQSTTSKDLPQFLVKLTVIKKIKRADTAAVSKTNTPQATVKPQVMAKASSPVHETLDKIATETLAKPLAEINEGLQNDPSLLPAHTKAQNLITYYSNDQNLQETMKNKGLPMHYQAEFKAVMLSKIKAAKEGMVKNALLETSQKSAKASGSSQSLLDNAHSLKEFGAVVKLISLLDPEYLKDPSIQSALRQKTAGFFAIDIANTLLQQSGSAEQALREFKCLQSGQSYEQEVEEKLIVLDKLIGESIYSEREFLIAMGTNFDYSVESDVPGSYMHLRALVDSALEQELSKRSNQS